jgi:hypothetical protein
MCQECRSLGATCPGDHDLERRPRDRRQESERGGQSSGNQEEGGSG